ncbi:hypothetical protein EMIHUDRAFT_222090 [Emiliania huxleyi CCMP1516]|uniref:Uncharacterized protein n=2 Tax=Emiliania huxleyi TaxID=2903 RepID=A0A0D3KZ46_EMIH1|nr:hypothetical protein EMIHUDRAFT_222090 [Emiliania huxleyi CCMP1516]EOD41031.1 hypothetical protein EMIHUDRAFT_222090 [Emiliania huxleyi CCMP1516]|eukprot:XP_005793460.1 hypothetical protein EMIHUDRAFT_222090 [Emiliania huxleyi CCMP1516]
MSAQSAVSACLGLDSDALYALYAPDSGTAGASLAEEGAGSMVPLRSMLGGTLGGAALPTPCTPAGTGHEELVWLRVEKAWL